jgi:ABC-2 type transport system ATP-binding protein
MLRIRNLEKSYGPVKVLEDVSISVREGECYSLIGKNGAGKSTLINIIADLLKFNEGELSIFNQTYEENAFFIKSNIGVLPEFNPLIEEFSGNDFLEYIGTIYSLPNSIIKERIDWLLSYFFEDDSTGSKSISEYSKGMKIKIGICAALIHKPKLLILDEPFDNLDPVSCKHLINFLIDYRQQGNAILVSSHDLSHIVDISTHIGILNNRKIEYESTLQEILDKSKNKLGDFVTKILGYNTKQILNF